MYVLSVPDLLRNVKSHAGLVTRWHTLVAARHSTDSTGAHSTRPCLWLIVSGIDMILKPTQVIHHTAAVQKLTVNLEKCDVEVEKQLKGDQEVIEGDQEDVNLPVDGNEKPDDQVQESDATTEEIPIEWDEVMKTADGTIKEVSIHSSFLTTGCFSFFYVTKIIWIKINLTFF